MSEFEWVGDERSESYRDDIEGQVKEYKDQCSRMRDLVQLMVGVLSLFTLIETAQYFLYILPHPPVTYSINIDDTLVNKRSPANLTHEGVRLDFTPGMPNKVLAVFVGLVAVFLLLEFFFNAWRISSYTIYQPDDEYIDYSTLKKWRQENRAIIEKSDYLLSGMRKKGLVLFFPGVLSLCMLQIITGYAYLANVLNPAFQIIVLDLVIIVVSLLAISYEVIKLTNVVIESLNQPDKMPQESMKDRIRTGLRSRMNGVLGPLSTVAVIAVWGFIIYSGLIEYLLDIFRLWLYARGGLA